MLWHTTQFWVRNRSLPRSASPGSRLLVAQIPVWTAAITKSAPASCFMIRACQKQGTAGKSAIHSAGMPRVGRLAAGEKQHHVVRGERRTLGFFPFGAGHRDRAASERGAVPNPGEEVIAAVTIKREGRSVAIRRAIARVDRGKGGRDVIGCVPDLQNPGTAPRAKHVLPPK